MIKSLWKRKANRGLPILVAKCLAVREVIMMVIEESSEGYN